MYSIEDMKDQLVTDGNFARAELEAMDEWKIIAEWLRLPLLVP